MSILLEALRKSEKSKRAHEAPTIHAEDETETVPASLATGPLALLLVLALFMTGWFVWHQYQPPASDALVAQTGDGQTPGTRQEAVGSQSPVADTPKPAATSEPAAADERPATARQKASATETKDELASAKEQVLERVRAARAATSTTKGEKSGARQRTPVESYKPPPRSAPKTTAASESRTASRAATDNTAPPGDQQATAAATNQATVAATEPESKPELKPIPALEPKAEPASKPKPEPEEPLPIGYWELPDSVRANVPEIKFSVLVYSTDPSDRFVLINGERLMEGDNAGPDLVVKEIRREGVIFTHRLYQFLVEK